MGDIVDGKALFTAIDASMRKAKTVRMRSEAGEVLETDASFNDDDTTNVAMSSPEGEWRFVDDLLYFLPKEEAQSENPTWVSMDGDTQDPDISSTYIMMKAASSQSPMESTSLLAKGRSTVTEVAHDGVVTYRIDVPATVIVQSHTEVVGGSDTEKRMAALRENAKGLTIKYEVVVDRRNLPAKISIDGDDIAALTGESNFPDTVVRYSRWGEPVNAQAPASEDVIPYDEAATEEG
ncbi:hypothetical protein ACMYYO_03490 [Dermacoccaceae bacterium W4C1]